MSDLVPFLNEFLNDEEILDMNKEFDSFTKKLDHSREVKLAYGNDLVLFQFNMEQLESYTPTIIDANFVVFRSEKNMALTQNIHLKEIKNFLLLIGGVQVGSTMDLRYNTHTIPGMLDNDGYGHATLCDVDFNAIVVIKVGPFSRNEDFVAFLLGDTSSDGIGPSLEDAGDENQESKKLASAEKFEVSFDCFLLRAKHLLERNNVGSAKSRPEINKICTEPVLPKALMSTKCPQPILLNAAASIRDMVKNDLKLEVGALKKALVASRTVTVTLASKPLALETISGQVQFVFEKHLMNNKYDSFFDVAVPEFSSLSFTTTPLLVFKVSIGGIDIMRVGNSPSIHIDRYISKDGWIRFGYESEDHDVRVAMKARAILNDSKDRINAPQFDQIIDKSISTFQFYLEKLGLMKEDRANFELVVENIQFRTKRFLGLFEFMEAEDNDLHRISNEKEE